VIFINQLREKIGVMFGNPEVTPGGRALKFYASIRLDVRRIGAIKAGDQIIGNRTKATVVKNKVAPPFRRAEFDLLYGEGISLEGDLIDMGLQQGVVVKSGAWFSFLHPGKGEVRLGQGREGVRKILKDNPELFQEVDALVRESLLPPPPPEKKPEKEGLAREKAKAGKTAAGKAAAARPVSRKKASAPA